MHNFHAISGPLLQDLSRIRHCGVRIMPQLGGLATPISARP
jgi:hypothetical protein